MIRLIPMFLVVTTCGCLDAVPVADRTPRPRPAPFEPDPQFVPLVGVWEGQAIPHRVVMTKPNRSREAFEARQREKSAESRGAYLVTVTVKKKYLSVRGVESANIEIRSLDNPAEKWNQLCRIRVEEHGQLILDYITGRFTLERQADDEMILEGRVPIPGLSMRAITARLQLADAAPKAETTAAIGSAQERSRFDRMPHVCLLPRRRTTA